MVQRFDDHDRDEDGRIPGDENVIYRGQADHAQHAFTFEVMDRVGITVEDLWPYYLSMGGDIDEYEVDAYLHGLMRLPAIERDLLSQSVNEMIDDIARGPRAPYSAGRSNNPLGAETDSWTDAKADTDAGTEVEADLGRWGLPGNGKVFERHLSAADDEPS